MKLSLVSYLDEQSSLMVRKIQQDLSEITGSRASLSSWQPHVTVGDGVEVNDDQLPNLKNNVQLIACRNESFELKLNGIGSLDNWKGGAGETPYVIYFDVVLNENLLAIVHAVEAAIDGLSKWYIMSKPYLPHCTLAFRDLTKDGYEKGLAYLAKVNPELKVMIDHIALVEKLPEVDREFTRFQLKA